MAEFDAWFVRIRDRQDAGEPLTVMEHTALAYVVRSGSPGGSSGGRIPREFGAVLAKSWLHLAGRPVRVQGFTARLPRSVLRGASREVRLFHMAAFQPRRPTAAWPLRSAGRDYVPELSDAVAAAGAALVAASGPGRAMLGSAALGYAVATVAEYGMHRWAGHEGGGPIKPFLKRLGRMGEKASGFLEAIRVGHFVVHHAKTSNRHYTAQFAPAPPGDRATIDAELDALGAVGRRIKESDYGMTLSHAGVAAGLLATLPVHAALIWALALGPLSAAALVAPSLLYVAASKSLHPFLHKSRDEAMTRAGPLMRRLLETRYAEWISRSHWVHHKGGGGNFNLTPGADLIFGDYKKPDLRMLFRMRADRILGADWSVPGPGAKRAAS